MEHTGQRVPIYLGFILNPLRPGSIHATIFKLQCVKCFFEVNVSWRHTRNQDGLGVASQRVLQNPCKFGVSVRNVAKFGLAQGRDDISQTQQSFVYIDPFY